MGTDHDIDDTAWERIAKGVYETYAAAKPSVRFPAWERVSGADVLAWHRVARTFARRDACFPPRSDAERAYRTFCSHEPLKWPLAHGECVAWDDAARCALTLIDAERNTVGKIVSQAPPPGPDLADRVAGPIDWAKHGLLPNQAAAAQRAVDEARISSETDRVAGLRAQIAKACEMLGLDGNAYVLDAPSLRREIEASWRELGVDMEEVLACDDPDVRLLSQSIAVSLQYEKDKVEMAVEHAVAEERKRAVRWLEGLERTLARTLDICGSREAIDLAPRRGLYDGIARDIERGAHLQDTTKKGG